MKPEQIIMILVFLNKVLNPLNAELNPICHLLTLLGAHPILHISRIRVKRKRKKRNRKLCVHPIFTFRITNGAFFTLFDEPEKDERSLFIFQCVYNLAANYTKPSKIRFKKQIRNMGRCLTAREGLAVTLRYMFEIHGCFAVKGNQHNHISL